MKAKLEKKNKVKIIARDQIPAINSIMQHGQIHSLGELRDFHKHDCLKEFVPEQARLSISWTNLEEGKSLTNHQHPQASMIIVCQGSGLLTGELEQHLNEGDVITIPINCLHGFIGGKGGMNCLSIQFEEIGGLYENLEKPQVKFTDKPSSIYNLDNLIDDNKSRMSLLYKHRFFEMLQDKTLEDESKRKKFLDCMQVWTDKNQLLLMTRQSMCKDEIFRAKFLEHFHEEIGHDKLYKDRDSQDEKYDAVIDAIACWFVLQMYQLDNVEKAAIIHLVIENASDHYHKLARPLLNKFVNDEYFKVHEEDTKHAQWGIDLLQGYNERTYLRLNDVINEAWDMLDAMITRVVEITEDECDD